VNEVRSCADFPDAIGASAWPLEIRRALRLDEPHRESVRLLRRGSCFAMGEAAGRTAALALAHGGRVRAMPAEAVQARPAADGAFLGREGDASPDTV
jgi:hypothetical protein